MKASHSKGILFVGVLFASLSAIFARYSAAPAVILSLYRMGWSVLLLLPAALGPRCRGELRDISRRDVIMSLISGIFFALHLFLWFEALKHTSIAGAAVLLSTEVIFAALGYSFLMGGHMPSMAVAAIIISMAGSGLVAIGGQGSPHLYGNLLALGAAVASAVYTLIGRAVRSRISTTVYTFLLYCSCLACLLLAAAFSGTPLTGYAPKELAIALALCIFCNFLGHSIFSWCLRYLSPSFVSAVKLAEPVVAAVLGLILFREMPQVTDAMGGAAILGGLLLYCRVEDAEARLDGAAAPEALEEETPSKS